MNFLKIIFIIILIIAIALSIKLILTPIDSKPLQIDENIAESEETTKRKRKRRKKSKNIKRKSERKESKWNPGDKVLQCPNSTNQYHQCSPYCQQRWGKK